MHLGTAAGAGRRYNLLADLHFTTRLLMDRSTTAFLAQLAGEAQRYDEMAALATQLLAFPAPLQSDEFDLLVIAFKNLVGPLRLAWRVTTSIQDSKTTWSPARALDLAKYRAQIAAELQSTCEAFLSLLRDRLLPEAPTVDAKVAYLKTQGDYYRYMAEVNDNDTTWAMGGAVAYNDAWNIAIVELTPTSPTRLGLALNFAVYLHDIGNARDAALAFARSVFSDALDDLDSVSDNKAYQFATMIMQALRGNIEIWTDDA
ncbi:hypothetical protein SDRG_13109 [Saprolegnia diclina VS20]|uniref:14-3-3 domain-containing protein n=1 Tax=Saprolegnia diclina (strain VS20) TaxID=1156394 RepID=T0Q3R3_SAPDV|nr:hypothetical protein SDRG_13109 [Saprolegnia diclina VS20]EQC29236.1 hypothetical protein SDRG_13109 [Saprolegnia diclina VS20]|eukprot:XP_008617414.1 hypothetical protein SDRG_13109 [Saprolegnia diclina VS20]